MHLPSAGEYPSFLTGENKNYITNYITSGNADAAKSYIVALIEQSAENGIPYEHPVSYTHLFSAASGSALQTSSASSAIKTAGGSSAIRFC